MELHELAIAFTVGVAANLLTPSIRNGMTNAVTTIASKASSASSHILQKRLKQLEREREYIEKLAENPLDIAYKLVHYTLPQMLNLWVFVIVIVIVVISVLNDGAVNLNQPLGGALFGLLGYATRFPLGSIITMNDLDKVNKLEKFQEKNTAEQNHINQLIVKQKS